MIGEGLRARLLPPVEQEGADGHPKPSRMEPQEQLVAAALGLANVAISAGSATVMGDQRALVLVSGLLAAAITVVGARLGNRIVAIAGLFASTLLRPSSATIFLIVVMPYYAAAMWMFLRYNRLVKAQAVRRRQARAEGGGPDPAGRTRTSTRGAATRTGGKTTKAGKARPTASKRYTPPKPVKKPPPPPPKPPRDRSILD